MEQGRAAAEAERLRPGESGLLALDWWNGNRSILVDVGVITAEEAEAPGSITLPDGGLTILRAGRTRLPR